MSNISAGSLRERIIFQYCTPAQDALGWPDQTWVTLATVWASVSPISSNEMWKAHREITEVDTKFKIRYRKDIQPTYRILWKNKLYKIYSVIDVNAAGRELEVLAKEQVNW